MPRRHYYEVDTLAAGASEKSVFTYHSGSALRAGSLVVVPLGSRQSLGVVRRPSTKPKFSTKPAKQVPLPALPATLAQLADWAAQYYATPSAKVWQSILPANPHVRSRQKEVKQLRAKGKKPKITLTKAQSQVIKQIATSSKTYFLLHGVTGSGKTQVYIELASQSLAEGKSVIILVPEISLTPQITNQLIARFGQKVILTHSGLTDSQRRQAWQNVLTSKSPKVIVGPRSAVFMPTRSLGYIFIDESHDPSYKQSHSPRYHTHAIGAQLAKLSGAKLVLGTATPLVVNRYLAHKNRISLSALKSPIYTAKRKPPIIVDLKDKTLLKKSHLVSAPLIKALSATLKNNRQSILFLNRRGSARLALCSKCGWTAVCPNCQIPLTWHGDVGQLRCHWCNHSEAPPASCPDCAHLNIRFVGAGTKRLEDELAKLLPGAQLARLDRDNFNPKTIGKLYQQLQQGQIDILIGTQMITKGLDLPGVETVGVVLADSMLYLPDFSASERTFQLLFQVCGRAGRRDNTLANAVIQTYSPNHPAITAAAARNYEQFYKGELADRKSLSYPPFTYLLKLTTRKSSRQAAQKDALELAKKLQADFRPPASDLRILGPAPTWHETLGGNYEWQIIVKSKTRKLLVKVAQNLPRGWTHDLDPVDLL